MDITTNLCIRCGKQRVDIKTYQEVVGNTVVVYTETACPDSECQKKVDKQLAKEKELREQHRLHLMAKGFQSKNNTNIKK